MVKQKADIHLLEELVQIGSRVHVLRGNTTQLEFGFPHHISSENRMSKIGDVVMHVVLTHFSTKTRTQAHVGYTVVDENAIAKGAYVEVMATEHYLPKRVYEQAAHTLGMYGVSRETLREAAASTDVRVLARYAAREYQNAIDRIVETMEILGSTDVPSGALASRYFATPQYPHAEGVIVAHKAMRTTHLHLLGAGLHGVSVEDEDKKDRGQRRVVPNASLHIRGSSHHLRAQLSGRLDGSYTDPRVLEEAVDSLAAVKNFTYTPAGVFGLYVPHDRFRIER